MAKYGAGKLIDSEIEKGTCSSCVAFHLLSTFLSRHRFKKSLNSGDLKAEVVKNRLEYGFHSRISAWLKT